MHKGSCLCGAVAFEVDGPLRPPVACHCGQCRKQSGHYWCATSAALGDFRSTGTGAPEWYKSSPQAKRGFCRLCGSTLFWQHSDENRLHISMSAFDTPTGLRLSEHIFAAHKGDYYDIADDVPQRKD